MKHAPTAEILREWDKNKKYFSQSGWAPAQAIGYYMGHSKRPTGSLYGWASTHRGGPGIHGQPGKADFVSARTLLHKLPKISLLAQVKELGREVEFKSQGQESERPCLTPPANTDLPVLVNTDWRKYGKTRPGKHTTSVLGAAAVTLLCQSSESRVNVSAG